MLTATWKRTLLHEPENVAPSRDSRGRPGRMPLFLLLLLAFLFCSHTMAAAKDFTVEHVTPEGLIMPGIRGQHIEVVFSTPVIKSDDTGKELDPEHFPIELSPQHAGQGMWATPLTFVYLPYTGDFLNATEYTIQIRKDLRDLQGKALKGKVEFRFHTPPLAFRSIRQVAFNTDQRYVDYQLDFSLPVSPSRLQRYLVISDDAGNRVPYSFRSGNSGNAVHIRVPGGDGSNLALRIGKGFRSEQGPLGLSEDIIVKTQRDFSMVVRNSYVRSDYDGRYIYVEFSGEIDVEKAKSFVELSPDKKFTLDSWGGTLRINGDFQPRDRIVLKLRRGLPPLKGGGLKSDWERAFIFPDIDPVLQFNAQGRFLSPANEKLLLPIKAVNVEKVEVIARRVYDNNVAFLVRGGWPYYVEDLAEPVFVKTYQVPAKPNETVQYSLDLQKILDGRKGLFEVLIRKVDSWQQISRLINITDIAGTMKLYETGALVWANSISGGTPLKDVKVTIYSQSNQLLATGNTNTNGVCEFHMESPWKPNLLPDMAILQKGDDVSVLRLDETIWRRGDEEFDGVPYPSGAYQGICFTPRGVFRPGEEVSVYTLLRDQKLSLKEPFPVLMKVRSSRGKEWSNETLMLSAYGIATGKVQLSDAAPTGTWRVEISVPGSNSPIAATDFLVEDFAPPRISVETSSDKKMLLSGEEAKLHIFAKYLFGAPADGLSYEVETTFIPREYSHPAWKDYRFTDERISLSEISQTTTNIATGTLSSSGEANLTFPVMEYDVPSMLNVICRTGVREDNGRWVYKTMTLPYYPRTAYLGIKTPDEYITSGKPIPLSFAAVDIDGKAISSPDVKLTVYRVQSRNITTLVDGRRRSEIKYEYIPLEAYENQSISFEQGVAFSNVVFESRGNYLIALEDDTGELSAAVRLYVYDSRWSYSDAEATLPESLNITLDKDIYRIGDNVTAQVTGNFAGTMLLTVETDKILYYAVAKAPNGSAEFSLKVTEEMLPNAWITAHLIRKAQPEEDWTTHRAFGAVPLYLDGSLRKLTVDLQGPHKVQPDARNDFSLMLKGADGRGRQGEVVIMLVDDGVLSLTRYQTPNFFESYMKKRALAIHAYDIYQELMPLRLQNPPLLQPGGGAGEDMEASVAKASLSPVKADRFKVLTLCQRVMTDKAGRADFFFLLPEFSGRARLMAVAASRSAFGAADATFEIARDVVTELALPRVLAPNDVFDAPILAFNRTGSSLDMEVELSIEGPVSVAEKEGEQPAGAKRIIRRETLSASESGYRIPLRLQAGAESGLARFVLTTRYGNASYTQRMELAVRPPYPRISKNGMITLKAGESVPLELPAEWFPGTRRATIAFSGLPAINLSDAARFLINYPYYCLEQTVSSGWALLSQPDIVRHLDPALATREQLADALNERILRIQALQMYNGAFSPWPQSAASNWSTAYAVHFLIACEAKGVKIPKETLDYALTYLQQLIALTPQSTTDTVYGAELGVRAYICYVLSLRNAPPLAWMSYLRDNIRYMPEYGKILLAASYARSGQKDVARTLLGDNAPAVPIIAYAPAVQELPNYDSPLRTQALYLLAWNEIDPMSANTAVSAQKLLESLRQSSRYTTQEAGFALYALGDFYAYHAGGGKAHLQLLRRDGSLVDEVSGDEKMFVRPDKNESKYTFVNVGDSLGYLTWTADGVPTVEPAPENKGVEAWVVYQDSQGRRLPKNFEVIRGERITGRIFIRSLAGTPQNLVVSLPLAGGLEIENPRLMDSQAENEYDPNQYNTARAELRDDRLLLFVDYIGNSYRYPFIWSFQMRAVTSGSFTLPPVAVEGMYSPGTRSIGATSRMTVKP